MPDLISMTQSSFIKGRSTRDNIIVMQEILHSLRSKKKNKTGCMVMKLDLEKAYDRVSWPFLEDTLVEFNFPSNLVKLIMFCVRNARSQILWNGEPLEAFQHTCGLRQGDPLSPYLFVLCMERLSYIINEKVNRKKWHPIKPCRGSPAFSHLFFADDLILMSKVDTRNARVIRSGLHLNLRKSKVYFSNIGGAALKRSITGILGFDQTPNLGKYLGVSLRHGRQTRAEAGALIDKVSSRFEGWKKKFLSTAGRATLIQAVTSAIPLYDMQAGWIPEHVCARLDKLNRDILWSNDIAHRKNSSYRVEASGETKTGRRTRYSRSSC